MEDHPSGRTFGHGAQVAAVGLRRQIPAARGDVEVRRLRGIRVLCVADRQLILDDSVAAEYEASDLGRPVDAQGQVVRVTLALEAVELGIPSLSVLRIQSTLIELSRHRALAGPARAAYERAARSLRSQYERDRALAALSRER